MGKTTVTLASGREMPLVGFGLWKVPRETAAETVYNAIKAGYRLFDGAYDYQNEKEAGEGIRRAIDERLVEREDVFITTKLWNNYHRKEHALAMAKKQNEAWGLGYIDLYLIHFPCALEYIDPAVRQFPAWWMDEAGTISLDKVAIRETWEALETVVDQGIARSIGVSNFQAQAIYDILSYARHPISSLQIEHHPYLVQSDLVTMAQENGIVVTAYSSFGPQKPVKKAAEKYRVTPAQVLLRWATQRNVAVIPKSNNRERLGQNLQVTEFDMTKDELEDISALDQGLRFNDPGFYLTQPIRIFA
ncbi:aldo/keto reductase family domain-containing protein [Trichoderma breve]|uniref:Aldo/keto reductase family domain-containing protein n=1 Tax=Trichoderma breve TaxID=2034170 RepID=A0A9W9B4G8_9HYPO|nr:aldo/keto reductase family domain-containing protein [Trichoderma breve]KAJ4855985.1 aldo/keto reductase family domain-containing protein [Trichoderma breve]